LSPASDSLISAPPATATPANVLPADEASAEWQAKVAGKNISETSLLATDYLNHFNEVIMLIGMIPDMAEVLEDVRAWQPKSYADHFRDSGFSAKELAIEAYEHSPPKYKRPFDRAVERLDVEIGQAIERLAGLLEKGNADELRYAADEATRKLQGLTEFISAIINGKILKQEEIDRVLEA
jgi:hypothetical protein